MSTGAAGATAIMVHLGQTTTRSVTEQVTRLGRRLLVVTPVTHGRCPGGTRSTAPPFDQGDALATGREVSGILVALAVMDMATVVFGSVDWTAVVGTAADLLPIGNWEGVQGLLPEPAALASGACVLRASGATEPLGAQEPLGAGLSAGMAGRTVVGVLRGNGQSGMGQDDHGIMPPLTVQRCLADTQDAGMIHVAAQQDGDSTRVQGDSEQAAAERVAAHAVDLSDRIAAARQRMSLAARTVELADLSMQGRQAAFEAGAATSLDLVIAR